ncbi:MAG: formate dehydrogenase accessory sulfurtransferase FdhD [Anaerolineales bacterium]|nr:formate dehydrogenase accessory sulfurtransferase FdhD [Anaerolineales bacterium]
MKPVNHLKDKNSSPRATHPNNPPPMIEAETITYHVFENDQWFIKTDPLVIESFITLYVNGNELVTMMATPYQQKYLAIGYLYTEGWITNRQDILDVSLAPNHTCIDVWLKNKEIKIPKHRILTSGCGKGVTFRDLDTEDPLPPPIQSQLTLNHSDLYQMMTRLHEQSKLYQQTRGIHAAGLASTAGLVMAAEDVGRHNTIDKLAGFCLLNDIKPSDYALLSTGRISSEMLAKARRMGIPIVASRSSPTNLSVKLAQQWDITLVGYLRPNRMNVYSNPSRLQKKGKDHES